MCRRNPLHPPRHRAHWSEISQRALLQRRLGKMSGCIQPRGAPQRHRGTKPDVFDQYADRVQQIIDKNDAAYFENARSLSGRNARSILRDCLARRELCSRPGTKLLVAEPYLFPDKTEFQIMVSEGTKLCENERYGGVCASLWAACWPLALRWALAIVPANWLLSLRINKGLR